MPVMLTPSPLQFELFCILAIKVLVLTAQLICEISRDKIGVAADIESGGKGQPSIIDKYRH